MVSPQSSSPSRAASLTLVGGELALDFANTSSGRGFPTREEHLHEAHNVVDWAAHARVLRERANNDSELNRRLFADALTLREDIYVLACEIAERRPAPPERIESLARTHARCLAQAKLVPFQGNFIWSWRVRSAPVEAVLGPISLSALTTLLQADLTRVKQCQGEKCGWMFLDRTKSRSRRWCEMEICGNRSKQKRHSAKPRSA